MQKNVSRLFHLFSLQRNEIIHYIEKIREVSSRSVNFPGVHLRNN